MTRRSRAVALLATALLASACASGSGGSDSTSSEAGGGGDGPIKVGAAVSSTGKFAIEGVSTRHGYELWEEQVNERGGIDVGGTKRPVEVIYYDDQSDPETAVKLVQRLISEDEVDFIFGPYSSGLTIATSAIAAQYKKIMFAGAAAGVSVFNQGNEYVFSPLSLTNTYNETGLEALSAQGAKTVGIMHSDDAPMSDIAAATKEKAEELGMQVVSVQSVPPDATDIKGAIGQIAGAKPDVFVEAGTTLMGLLATRTMRDVGFAPKHVLMVQAPTEVVFVEELGAETTEGIMGPTQWVPTDAFEDEYFGTAQDYYDTYLEKYGEAPSYLPAGASAAGLALQLAVEEAGSLDVEEVRHALWDMKADTFFGTIDFTAPDDPSGLIGANVDRPMVTIQLDAQGNQVVVAPEEAADSPIQPFKPWNAR